jgi:3-oxosteroid 1-dehydrogenase
VALDWDIEVDFVAIGSGIGGLAGAVAADEHGLSAVVLEKSSMAGGVSAYSYGEVWVPGNHLQVEAGIEDSLDSGRRYTRWLSMGFGDPEMIEDYLVHGPIALRFFEEHAGLRWSIIKDFADYYYPIHEDAVREGRFIEVQPFPGASLGDWQTRTRTSPHVPFGLTHDDMFGQGGAANIANWDFSVMGARLEKDERCLGPGLAASFVKAALDRNIQIHLETPVKELLREDGRTVGVRATQDGRDLFIRANRGVLIAASGYDWDQDLGHLYDHRPGLVSAIPPSVTGDNLKLAGPLGAKVGQVPTPDFLGYNIPGEEHDGVPLWRLSLLETGLPHGVLVNRAGRRFGDESFYRSIGQNTLAIDGGKQTQPNYPCWHIIDSQYVEKYPYGSVLPGQGLPAGMAARADTLADLAGEVGIEPDQLEEEIERFNGFARDGIDPEFNRGEKVWAQFLCGDRDNDPNPNLGTVEKAPFYAIPQSRVGTGMVSLGIVADIHGQVIGYDDAPIEGLYVTGNAMARSDTGAGYQSGMANGRGMVFGFLAACHAAGKPSRELDAVSHTASQ